jgi:FtsH-binding integral membrane protein
MNSFLKLINGKKKFILTVYSILILQLIVTFTIIYSFRDHPFLSEITKKSLIFYMFMTLGILLVMLFIKMPTWLRFILFCLFTVFIAGMLHSISFYLSKELIDKALYGAISIFIAMTLFGFIITYFGIDISWIGMYLLAALLGLIIASILIMFMYVDKYHKILIIIGLVIFSMLIVYNTNIILLKNNVNVIDASLDFYLSFVNIFMHLLGR